MDPLPDPAPGPGEETVGPLSLGRLLQVLACRCRRALVLRSCKACEHSPPSLPRNLPSPNSCPTITPGQPPLQPHPIPGVSLSFFPGPQRVRVPQRMKLCYGGRGELLRKTASCESCPTGRPSPLVHTRGDPRAQASSLISFTDTARIRLSRRKI